MRDLDTDTLAALSGAHVVLAAAAKFSFGETYRYWSGYGTLTIPGEGDFTGIGAGALVTPYATELGGAAAGATIRLSGLDPDAAALIEEEDYHQKPVVLWALVCSPDGGALIQAIPWIRGRVDTIVIDEAVGGQSALEIAIEGPARVLSRAGARTNSDSDQRTLAGAADGSGKHVSVAGQITLYWGKKPATAQAANGGFTGPPIGLGVFGLVAWAAQHPDKAL